MSTINAEPELKIIQTRLPPDETSATIKSFMAHHQGMSLLALVNLLHDNPMPRRFLACPLLKAADLLLQKRVPKTIASVFVEDLKLEESRNRIGVARLDLPEHLPPGAAADSPEATRNTPVLEHSRP